MKNIFNIFLDKNKDVSSRIVFTFVVIIFDLFIALMGLIFQKDIPDNASNILITITTACVPVAILGQAYQNVKERELEENRDINGNGKIGE